MCTGKIIIRATQTNPVSASTPVTSKMPRKSVLINRTLKLAESPKAKKK